jgi:basic membrane protein A
MLLAHHAAYKTVCSSAPQTIGPNVRIQTLTRKEAVPMSTKHPSTTRRDLIKAMAAAGVASAVGPGLLGRALAADKIVVGVIYVGPKDDYGYNQAQAQAAAAIKKLPGVTVVEEEKVPETVDVQKTMASMIEQDGAVLIFPTSFGYFDPHMIKMAEKYPKVRFAHCGGMWTEGKHPKNAGSYFGYIDECQYLNGVVAGHTSKSKKLGFIAAKPIPQVLRNINAFTLGAQSVNPAITTQVIFTGDWSLPVKEAEAANSLIDQGVDVITMHVDSPKVIVETAERRGIFVCGYHANQSALAPKGYLTGAEWNWLTPYTVHVKAAQEGKPFTNFLRGGLKEGFVKPSPYGKAVSDAARKDADGIKGKMLKDEFVIFKGPLKDNTGKVVIPGGTMQKQTDIVLEQMNYLVAGVVGKV